MKSKNNLDIWAIQISSEDGKSQQTKANPEEIRGV
jgi:hypothetical protein